MESTTFIKVGDSSVVSLQRLIAIVAADSAPIRRMIQEARERGTLIDTTYGKKNLSVLIMDSDHLILSSRTVEQLNSIIETACDG
ncbi:MAG: extracellular matrix/biofilm biosynthesis regulator RemA family protein [Saccharofermentanales bacterium]